MADLDEKGLEAARRGKTKANKPGLPTAALSHERLKEVISYDPDSGAFTWRARIGRDDWNARYAGTLAGTLGVHGYLQIRVDYGQFLAHRLAWLYMTGEYPDAIVDHIDGNKLNNCFSNLRTASQRQNQANAGLRADNSSGYKGVDYLRKQGKWRAAIKVAGQRISLGTFATPSEAHDAYKLAALQFNGKYARFA